jgi:hypothetical protein
VWTCAFRFLVIHFVRGLSFYYHLKLVHKRFSIGCVFICVLWIVGMNCYVCIARPCVIIRYHWKLAVKKGK